jgi:KaiC/GvpD/RAD55 family RecA-like ATPase
MVSFGIPLLDKLLPKGVWRSSFMLLAGEGGTGKSYILHLLAASILKRNEPVVYVALDDDPKDIISSLEAKGVDVENYVKNKMLLLVDGYGGRYGYETNTHVAERLRSLDIHAAVSTITRVLDSANISGKGIVIIDSLNPFFQWHETNMVYDFVNMIRILISKKRSMLVAATLHTPTQLYADIAATMEYMVDVFIVLRYHSAATEAGYPVKEILVKKARGTPVAYGWVPFMITDQGIEEVRIKYRSTGEEGERQESQQ